METESNEGEGEGGNEGDDGSEWSCPQRTPFVARLNMEGALLWAHEIGSIAVGLNESRDAETQGSRVEVYDASGKSLFVHAFPDHRILSLTQGPAEGQLGSYRVLLNQLSPIGILEEHAADGRHWSIQVEASALDAWASGDIAAVGRRAEDWKRQQVTWFNAQGEAKGSTEVESPPNAMLSLIDIRVSREDTMVVAGTVLRDPSSSMDTDVSVKVDAQGRFGLE